MTQDNAVASTMYPVPVATPTVSGTEYWEYRNFSATYRNSREKIQRFSSSPGAKDKKCTIFFSKYRNRRNTGIFHQNTGTIHKKYMNFSSKHEGSTREIYHYNRNKNSIYSFTVLLASTFITDFKCLFFNILDKAFIKYL